MDLDGTYVYFNLPLSVTISSHSACAQTVSKHTKARNGMKIEGICRQRDEAEGEERSGGEGRVSMYSSASTEVRQSKEEKQTPARKSHHMSAFSFLSLSTFFASPFFFSLASFLPDPFLSFSPSLSLSFHFLSAMSSLPLIVHSSSSFLHYSTALDYTER